MSTGRARGWSLVWHQLPRFIACGHGVALQRPRHPNRGPCPRRGPCPFPGSEHAGPHEADSAAEQPQVHDEQQKHVRGASWSGKGRGLATSCVPRHTLRRSTAAAPQTRRPPIPTLTPQCDALGCDSGHGGRDDCHAGVAAARVYPVLGRACSTTTTATTSPPSLSPGPYDVALVIPNYSLFPPAHAPPGWKRNAPLLPSDALQ